jgi:hypothetical protein
MTWRDFLSSTLHERIESVVELLIPFSSLQRFNKNLPPFNVSSSEQSEKDERFIKNSPGDKSQRRLEQSAQYKNI